MSDWNAFEPPKMVNTRIKPPADSWWICDRDEFKIRSAQEYPRMVGSATNRLISPITVGQIAGKGRA